MDSFSFSSMVRRYQIFNIRPIKVRSNKLKYIPGRNFLRLRYIAACALCMYVCVHSVYMCVCLVCMYVCIVCMYLTCSVGCIEGRRVQLDQLYLTRLCRPQRSRGNCYYSNLNTTRHFVNQQYVVLIGEYLVFTLTHEGSISYKHSS